MSTKTSAPAEMEGIIEAFDEISGLCRHLRQGGPVPEDLQDLSDALHEAVDIAANMLHALTQQPAADCTCPHQDAREPYHDAACPARLAQQPASRVDVLGLVAKLAAHVRPTCSELWDEAQAFLAQQPEADQFIATFRCENSGIVGTTDAKIHSVTRHDDGRIEVVIDHWPKQPAAGDGAVCPNCERLTEIRHCQACGCDFIAAQHQEPKP